MKLTRSIAIFVFCLLCATSLSAQAVKLSDEQTANAKKYQQLRMDYTKSEQYDPYDRQDKVQQDSEVLFEQGKYAEVLQVLAPALKANPYSVELLPLQIVCLRKLGKNAEADVARQVFAGVIDSVLLSGDGRTAETAMHVITTAEEYSVMRLIGVRLIKQSLVEKDGHSYDVMTVRDADDNSDNPKTIDLYFNIDLPLNWLKNTLTPGASTPGVSETKSGK